MGKSDLANTLSQLMACARQHLERGNHAAAFAAIEKAFRTDPAACRTAACVEVLVAVATACKAGGDRKSAIAAYECMIELQPRFDPESRLNDYVTDLGRLLFCDGQFQRAASAFAQVVATDEENAFAWHALGMARARLEQWEAAIDAWQHAIAAGACWHSFLALGQACLQAGAYEQAAEAFEATIKIRPACPEAFIGLAQAAERIGHRDWAINSYQAAFDLAPENPVYACALIDADRL